MKVLDTKTNNAGLEASFSRIKRGKGDADSDHVVPCNTIN